MGIFGSFDRGESAASFMLFSYFGIANTDNRYDTVKAAINRGYRDAASHVLSFTDGKAKQQARKNGTVIIAEAIEKLKKGSFDYDVWHKKLVGDLEAEYEKYEYKHGYSFTCGIAQKWVNMTMKYMYILYFYQKKCGVVASDYQLWYGETVEKYLPSFHVPVDSYIIKASKKDFRVVAPWGSWSRMESYPEYFEFQKAIREGTKNRGVSPIEWEGSAWIETTMG